MIDEQMVAPAAPQATDPAAAEQPQAVTPQNFTKVAESLPENLREPFQRLVKAGEQVLYSEQTQELVEQEMSREGVPVHQKIAEGVAGLMGILNQQAKPGVPPELMVPAGIELIANLSDALRQSGREEVPEEEERAAMQLYSVIMFKGMGASDDQIMSAMSGGANGVQPQ